MAKIGVRYPRYHTMTINVEEQTGRETITYGTKKVLGKAISANVSITTTEAKLYADDGLAESVKEFVEGSISIGTDDLETETEADILGATVDAAGDIENSTDDAAPWMQIGFMAVRIRRNKKQYRGVLYKKVQFAVPSEDNQTKGQNITFTTPTLTGTIAALADGTWRKKSKWFDSADAADEWVDTAMSGT